MQIRSTITKTNIVCLLIGVMIGAGAGYFWPGRECADVNRQTAGSNSGRQSYSTGEKTAPLEPDVEALRILRSGTAAGRVETIGEEHRLSVDSGQAAYEHMQEMERERLYVSAMEALQQDELEQAKKLLNELLLKTEDELQREQVKQGLIDYYERSVERLRDVPGQADMVLFKLFEMYKLSPDDGLKNDIVNMSREVYEDAKQYYRENDLLTSADYYFSLSVLSKMMDFGVITATGDTLQSREFAAELKKIKSDPAYLRFLEARAEKRLYYGSEPDEAADPENFLVFWDHVNLALLRGSGSLQSDAFREDFVQASLYHLNRLKEMNDTFEIKSRIDFLRSRFPAIMTDERITGFY